MNARRLLIAASMAAFCAPALADGDKEAGEATFEEACARCHYTDDFDEKAKSLETLKAILAGEIRHRGGFAGLTEEDLANIAAYLAEQ